jgi:hypothetical protein
MAREKAQAAQALGLEISPMIRASADELIE